MQGQKRRTADEVPKFQLGLASQNKINVRQVLHGSLLLTWTHRAVGRVFSPCEAQKYPQLLGLPQVRPESRKPSVLSCL